MRVRSRRRRVPLTQTGLWLHGKTVKRESVFRYLCLMGGNGKKWDLPDMICPASLAELQTSFADFLIRTDGSVGSHRGTSNGRCYIPTLSVNLPDHLNYCTISSTAELCGIRFALQYLLNLPGEFKAVILTNSHARWALHLQWVPS